jgi:hypothetical protein
MTATVRIYNPSAPAAVVGSAWSSAVVVDSSVAIDSAAQFATETTGAQLAVISTRARLDGVGAKFTTGVVVTGTEAKTFVVRAVGRTLASFGVGDALFDPALSVASADGRVIAGNADWRNAADSAAFAQQSSAVGAFPLIESSGDGRDAALVVTLTPGSYAIEVVSESGASGVVLAEVYAVGETSAVNYLSAQNALTTGGSFTSGVSIGGTETRTVLLRAVGGGADTTLAVYSGTRIVASNDDWSYATNASDIANAAVQTSVAPLAADSPDAALLLRLNPGTYTLQVGANFAAPSGVRLEVIEVP